MLDSVSLVLDIFEFFHKFALKLDPTVYLYALDIVH